MVSPGESLEKIPEESLKECMESFFVEHLEKFLVETLNEFLVEFKRNSWRNLYKNFQGGILAGAYRRMYEVYSEGVFKEVTLTFFLEDTM